MLWDTVLKNKSNGVSTVEDPLDSTCLNTSEQATRLKKLEII